ncbi:hypothetical protein ASPVEDRAFT_25504 [Aspergillus versicolor CBS 583.65]|uniref:NAD-dependent epimerase/dehydratase domain-containing protein n=1 Tax=Aspergillus versicolor CBS 583.65 TaxID=1036611 RepID=A0A1L9PAZ8_ASPVE|nr:uncharacterized protein ASPVEDRAFT_25504 [Aspergillus versicolor CBS 583.65]OJI98643.1 hypothetical protein ASPVEDRAFT_25504 [Aspergillus versicolor CBS 583.65]
MTTNSAIFGSTGAVGSQILSTLLATPSSSTIGTVTTISRRAPAAESPHLQPLLEKDTTKWPSTLKTITPPPSIVYNAIGTTRAAAGGTANQWKIDHDLVIDTVQAAKEAGARTFVFVSSGGTRGSLSKYVPYSKMKIGVEDAIREMGFQNAIVLRPGMIINRGENSKAPVLERLVEGLSFFGQWAQDWVGQDQRVIGRAAVAAARIAEEGKAPSKYWVLEQADIVRLGRDEWKD